MTIFVKRQKIEGTKRIRELRIRKDIKTFKILTALWDIQTRCLLIEIGLVKDAAAAVVERKNVCYWSFEKPLLNSSWLKTISKQTHKSKNQW